MHFRSRKRLNEKKVGRTSEAKNLERSFPLFDLAAGCLFGLFFKLYQRLGLGIPILKTASAFFPDT